MHAHLSTPAPEPEERAPSDGARAGPAAWTAIAVLALLAGVCSAPLMRAGWFTNHEQIRPIARALAAYYEIADGDLYPRWLSTGYLGKGVPLFNFYPPAFSLLVAYAHALGVPLLLAAKLTIFLLFFVGSLGVWLWVRPHLGHFPALLAAILYLFAPYHFVDVYVRGAMAEFASLAAFPFLFLGIDLLRERFSARGLAILALSSAAIVLSHFLGAMMIAPFAAAYAAARTVRGGSGWLALGRVLAGAALGASISAFYWLPALAERDALSHERLQDALSGYYAYSLHFVDPRQWLDFSWGFGQSLPPGYQDGMSFQVGLLVAGASAASALLVWRLGRAARRFVLLDLALGIGALWLTTSGARAAYAWIEPLQLVQFPWRFLGPATLFLSAAGGGFARVLLERHRSLGPGVAAATAALAIVLSAGQRTVEARIPVDDEVASIEAAVAADGWSAAFGNVDEYLPRDASIEAASTQPGGPEPSGLGVDIRSVRAGRATVTFEVEALADLAIAIVRWHVFPGWKVSLDGREWPLVPGPYGLVAFQVPRGRHVARVHFGTTRPRVAGWVLALAASATLGALAVRERRAGRRHRGSER